MEKTLNIIDIILGVIVHLSVVFAAFIGAEDIYIAVNDTHVNLKLWVKIRPDWRNNLSDLKNLGYEK